MALVCPDARHLLTWKQDDEAKMSPAQGGAAWPGHGCSSAQEAQ